MHAVQKPIEILKYEKQKQQHKKETLKQKGLVSVVKFIVCFVC